MRITLRDLTQAEVRELGDPEFLDEVFADMPSIRDYLIRAAARKAEWRRQHATTSDHSHCTACMSMAELKTTTGGMR